jgi:hypothetical protein
VERSQDATLKVRLSSQDTIPHLQGVARITTAPYQTFTLLCDSRRGTSMKTWDILK